MQLEGLVRCNKCGGNYHPSNHIRTNPLSEAFPLQCGPPLVTRYWHGNGSPLRLYHPSLWAPRNCTGLLGLGYDMWHDYLIKFQYPTIAPQNSSFSLLFEEKRWGFNLKWLVPHASLFFPRENVASHVL